MSVQIINVYSRAVGITKELVFEDHGEYKIIITVTPINQKFYSVVTKSQRIPSWIHGRGVVFLRIHAWSSSLEACQKYIKGKQKC